MNVSDGWVERGEKGGSRNYPLVTDGDREPVERRRDSSFARPMLGYQSVPRFSRPANSRAVPSRISRTFREFVPLTGVTLSRVHARVLFFLRYDHPFVLNLYSLNKSTKK